MKTSSAKKPVSLTTARNSFFINQFATPGLGSLMAGRFLVGIGQILLAFAGFGFVVAWFLNLITQTMKQIDSDAAGPSVAWLGGTGAAIFAVAWIWSLLTSLSLLREARTHQTAPP